MNQERLEVLLDKFFDEALTAEEHREFESALLSSPQARTHFWKRARFHTLLRRRGQENWGRKLALEGIDLPEPTLWQRIRATLDEWGHALQPAGWWTAGALAAVVVLLAVNPWKKDARVLANAAADPNLPAPLASTAGLSQGVATMLRAVDVEWTGQQLRPGNVLGPGWLKFERGLVEVQFHRGARVVIEGPAEFELITDMQARCLAGKLQADVPPPAIGFEILSPQVRVVDRGTAFGLDVRPNGASEIHVFSGKVDYALTGTTEAARELLQGEAVRVDESGVLSDIPPGPAGFTTGEALEQRAMETMAARYALWKTKTERRREDPSLLVQYSFETLAPGNRVLTNEARDATRESQGTIIGCSRTEGRWPGKKALDFKQIGDRIRFALPKQHRDLTCVTWVRLDGIERPYTALLMSGDAVVGELQWQLRGAGRLNFGERQQAGWGVGKLMTFDSDQVVTPNDAGSWMQLAFVYSETSGTLVHYFNGRAVGNVTFSPGTPLTTGALEIGNWTPAGGNPMEPIRAFNGRMDEFLLFSRALPAEEVHELWELGRPL